MILHRFSLIMVSAGLGMLLLFAPCPAVASGNLEFTLHKLGSCKAPTLVIVGGIQGDEPGGFNAANLIVSHYRVTKGSVWVVPNLNLPAIIRSSRGVNGDLNRKFATLGSSDPDFETIRRIKAVLTAPEVDVILNLHDGSGYYRHTYIDAMRNPMRWGQSVIIDQESIPVEQWGALGDIARMVCDRVNKRLYDPEHALHVKNTKTKLGDVEMEKTLTYFAILRDKAAFGLEASKNFSSGLRAYYHLQMIEAFMHGMGIEFERPFELTAEAVTAAISSNVAMAFCGNKVFLDLENVRSRVGYVPLRRESPLEFRPSNPLLTMEARQDGYAVFYGNQQLTHLHPQYFEYDYSIDALEMTVDGVSKRIPFGSIVSVVENFNVAPLPGGRVNVIGYTHPEQEDESGLVIHRHEIMDRFSLDNAGEVYRVEAYKGERFAGMVLVRFDGAQLVRNTSREFSPPPEPIVIRKFSDGKSDRTAQIQAEKNASR